MTTMLLLQRTSALVARHQGRTTVSLILLTFTGMAVDFAPDTPWIALVPFLLAALYLQFWLTVRLLEDLGLRSKDAPGFGSFVIIYVVIAVGGVAGLLVLIVPGVILLVRWWVAVPVLLTKNTGPLDALCSSWRLSKGVSWPLFWACLIYLSISFPAGFATEYASASGSIPISLMGNLIFGISTILSWHLSVAAYVEMTGGGSTGVSDPA